MLLVWGANVIKHYAAFKWLGDDALTAAVPVIGPFGNVNSTIKERDLQQITIETKIKMRN